MTIFLIGYMACGKTTAGRALAKELGYQFTDLDIFIENRYRKSIAQLFSEVGENRFREIERDALHEAGEFCDTVVSCGGGTPCHFDNMEWMNAHGVTVWLDASVPTLVRRLLLAAGKRPIVAGKTSAELPAFIKEHMAPRLPYYSRAQIHISSDRLESATQIADTVAALIPLLPHT